MGKDEGRSGHNIARALLGHCTILVVALLVLFAGLAPLAFHLDGSEGLLASAVALATCLVCGILALLVATLFREPNLVLYQVLLTLPIRMGIPLILCIVVYLRPGPLTEGRFVYYLLAFYMVTLLVETGLAMHSNPKIRASDAARVF